MHENNAIPPGAQAAHRINNRLTVIVGALELIAESETLSPDLRPVIAAALQAADDLAHLAEEMKGESAAGALPEEIPSESPTIAAR